MGFLCDRSEFRDLDSEPLARISHITLSLHDWADLRGGLFVFLQTWYVVASGDARVLERYLATKVAKRSRWAGG
jgi:hypothetical protein